LKRLAAFCGLSLLLYVFMFGFVLERPLSLGLLQAEIAQKTKRVASIGSPKLVILAGSNAPFSHSCVVIGAMMNMPCANIGVAVGIGLDNLFLGYAPYLQAGDVVYMPMETNQFIITRAQNRTGVDAAMLLRHGRAMLRRLPPDRTLGALFCCTLADALESVAEMPIAAAHWMRPALMLASQFNAEGDRINADLANANKALLAIPPPAPPAADAIRDGYGARLIGNFVAMESARGVIIIGGLPTQFQDVDLSPAAIAAMREVYTRNGGRFVTLPNHSEYPRADFYDSKDHLAQPCQFAHSIAIAGVIAAVLHRQVKAPPPGAQGIADTCPGR
jgi:hypothetical protein